MNTTPALSIKTASLLPITITKHTGINTITHSILEIKVDNRQQDGFPIV